MVAGHAPDRDGPHAGVESRSAKQAKLGPALPLVARRGRFWSKLRPLSARGKWCIPRFVHKAPELPSAGELEIFSELERRFEAAYDDNGVDRSLIRWSLSLTPTQRVMAVEETLNALATLKRKPPTFES